MRSFPGMFLRTTVCKICAVQNFASFIMHSLALPLVQIVLRRCGFTDIAGTNMVVLTLSDSHLDFPHNNYIIPSFIPFCHCHLRHPQITKMATRAQETPVDNCCCLM
jgi:hypothetical protein